MSKSPDAFRTISEVADDLDLPQHVLRFWETRFSQIKPMKRGGGRRYYRPDDVELLQGIRHLLYDQGYTIKGVQKILRENGNKYVVAAGRGEDLSSFGEAADASKASTAESQTQDTVSPAMAVADLEKASKHNQPGILGRLMGQEGDSADESGSFEISADDKKQLQAILYDLLECKRLLDQVR